MPTIRRVAVLGAGTMGSRIAAHFANAGVPSYLLDIVLPGEANRNAAAEAGLKAAAGARPAAFYTDSARALVTTGNFEDDLKRIADCDWVIEAVSENLDVKRELWRKVEPLARPDAILSTNTSGISVARISEDFSPEFRRRFFGAHFFNPPRHLHLVELVPGPETDNDVLLAAASFCDRRLGKGVVPVKDTPNFIGNRIGAFFVATVQKIMVEDDYSIEEADLLTGPLIGLPKSASFRLIDIIGLDVWKAVVYNLRGVEGDNWTERFELPPFLSELIGRGWLGEKSGQGCYRRTVKDGARLIEVLDWKTLEYHEPLKPDFPSLAEASRINDLAARLRRLVSADDRAGRFLWKLFRDFLLYSAERIPDMSDRIVEVDRAMRWGYAFSLGPFELWDALGLPGTARRIEEEGRALPENVRRMIDSGATSFYRHADKAGAPCTEYFDLADGGYTEIESGQGTWTITDLKRASGVLQTSEGASLVDLGDGVLGVEFHSKMNVLGEDALRMLRLGLEETERNFEAMLIANDGTNFSAGADLSMFLSAARDRDWNRIDAFLRRFQDLNLALRYAAKPVVAAPFGHTLGGGCEVALHASRLQAGAELYMGLVEAAVGLIPAGGGITLMVARFGDGDRAYKLISTGRASGSAAEAREMGLLAAGDGITMNRDRLAGDAKVLALSLTVSYVPPVAAPIEAGGEALFSKLKMGAWLAHQSGRISEYDLVVAEKLAHVISGGRLTGRQAVTEQYLLDLEREAFLSLCGNEKTQDRIEHMLRKGKPLRN